MILNRIFLFTLAFFLVNPTTIQAMDPTSPRLRRDTNHAIAPEEQRRMDAEINKSLIVYASRNDMAGVVKCLQHGAQINAQDSEGQTALHSVIVTNYVASTPKLDFFKDPGHIPCGGKDDLVAFLIEQNADVNLVDRSQQTPLHYAARYDRVHALELLRSAGGNLNAKNELGSTPCHRAVDNNSFRAIAWLAKAGADMNWIDSSGLAPLHEAVHCERLRVTVDLLVHGARLDVRTGKNLIEDNPESTIIPAGSTVFHLAAIPNQNSTTMQRQLLYHALWRPEGSEIGKKEFITFLCCLWKGLPAAYAVRNIIFSPLLPYLVESLSRNLVIGFLGSNNNIACSAARNMLIQRMLFLKTIVAATDENGDTAYQLECRAKVQNRDNSPQTLLLASRYDEQFKEFTEAARSHTIADLPSDNILKAPYENAPPAQSIFSQLQTKVEPCCIS